MRLISWSPILFALSLPAFALAATPLRIPEPLESEHQALHATLAAAIKAGGKTGEAARHLEEQLRPTS